MISVAQEINTGSNKLMVVSFKHNVNCFFYYNWNQLSEVSNFVDHVIRLYLALATSLLKL